MTRVIASPELPDVSDRLYSHARVESGRLYMSGQVGWDAQNELAGTDIESQTRQAFVNVGTIVERVGMRYSDIAKVTSYFVDIDEHFSAYKDVWAEFFDEPYPCHTAIGVEKLAAPELLLEVEAEVPL